MLRNIKNCRWIPFNKYFDQSKKLNTFTTQKSYCVYLTNVKGAPESLQEVSKINLIQTSNTYLSIKRNMSNDNSKNSKIANKYTNRLSESKSPYLLQHAHNPVEWYPWGEEAIDRARQENKLIFLSVGYSTCHWCHVMERESFESEEVAKIMNEHFINIKVDREERPDIDKIYMQFVLMINGSGGWPMSVWLTPDLAPIAAGTYFPPQDRWGMPSFKRVLNSIASKWNTNQEELKANGLETITAIKNSLSERVTDDKFEDGSADQKLQEAIKIYKQRFDTEYGGFGMKPKFPEVPRINFLFHAYIITKDLDILDIALKTLENIGRGGIHDHVFGGFARYAVDRNWHIPHFEKMLYDQGQLMAAYSNAFKLTGETKYLNYAEGIYKYIVKDLCHPEGGFYAGEDADSLPNFQETTKVEGAFYAWNWEDVKDIVIKNGSFFGDITAENVFEIYAYHYGLKPQGNVLPSSDPHGHLEKKNILFISSSEEKTSDKFNINKEQLKSILNLTNNLLYDVRKLRPRPHLDTKIICSWNGLVLSGLAKLYSCDSENGKEHLETASRLVSFVKKHLFDEKSGKLIRSWYGNDSEEETLENKRQEHIGGFLDDYAFLVKGLLDYYKVSLDSSALHWAKQLQDMQDKLFWDEVNGAYFYSEENSLNVVVRLKEDHDGAEPCGNSVAAHNLVLISHYFDEIRYRDRACELFKYFSDNDPFGYVLPEMMSSLLLLEYGLDLVAIVGPNSSTTERFIEICRKFYVPEMVIVRVDPNEPNEAYSRKLQEKFKMVNGMPTVYICHNKVCRMPVVDPVKLQDNLKEKFFHAV